jgi:hypothetical protein
MRKRRLGKEVKREVTPEFVNMSKEILYPQIQGVTSCLVKGTPRPLFDEPRPGVAVSAWTEVELARKEDLVGRSLAGSSVSGTGAGIDLPRPRAGLMSLKDSWARPRGDQPSRLLAPDSWRRPGRRWTGRDVDVVLQSGDPRTGSPSEARSDLAEVLLTPKVLRLPSTVQFRACRILLSCSVCFLRPPRPKHTLAVL